MVRNLLFCITLTLISLVGCSDYSLRKKVEYAPEIHVTPLEHDFGPLNADGQNDQIEVRITNIGNDTLELNDVFLSMDTQNFYLQPTAISDLLPGAEVVVTIVYDPQTYETNDDELIILSNDEDESITVVHLDGSGDAPIINVSPVSYDFDMVYLGCDDTLTKLTTTLLSLPIFTQWIMKQNLVLIHGQLHPVRYFTSIWTSYLLMLLAIMGILKYSPMILLHQ